MKERLDEISLPNFVRAAEGALERSGASLADVAYLCGIHMRRSMHDALVDALGVDPERAAYLDDAGHMSGVDWKSTRLNSSHANISYAVFEKRSFLFFPTRDSSDLPHSMHDELVDALGVYLKRAAYLDDVGHMSS